MEQRYFKVMRANYESPLFYDLLGRSIGEVCTLVDEKEFTYTLRTSYLHEIFCPKVWAKECDKDGKIIYKSKFEELMDELHEMDKVADDKTYYMIIDGYAGYFAPRNQSLLTNPCECVYEDEMSVQLRVGNEDVWFPKSMVIRCNSLGEVLGELEEELDDEGRLRVTQKKDSSHKGFFFGNGELKLTEEEKELADFLSVANDKEEQEWMNAPMGSYQEKFHDACVNSCTKDRIFDSGSKRDDDTNKDRQFESGFVRDNDSDKPLVNHLDSYLRLRYGFLLRKGANNYGKHNWVKNTDDENAIESLHRHLAKYELNRELGISQDEDHLAAICFNVMLLMKNEQRNGIQVDHYYKYI